MRTTESFKLFESIESMKRLIQLRILPKPNKSWEIVVPALQSIYQDRVSSPYTNSVEIRFPEHGLMFTVNRETVARYSLTCYDINEEPIVIQEEDWGLPKQYLVPDPYAIPDMWAVAEAIIAKVQDWIKRAVAEHGTSDPVQESANFDRLLALGMVNVDNKSAWDITCMRLRHRFPQLEIGIDALGRGLRVDNPNLDPESGLRVYFNAYWEPTQNEGSSSLQLALNRLGSWQPLRRFSQNFNFDISLRNRNGKVADSVFVSKEFADLIGDYIQAWLIN